MATYFALFRFEPWVLLSPRQRRFVRRHCIHLLLTYPPVAIIRNLLLVSALISVMLLLRGWAMFVAFFLVIFVLSDLIDMIVVMGRRQEIGRYIYEKRAEIEAVV